MLTIIFLRSFDEPVSLAVCSLCNCHTAIEDTCCSWTQNGFSIGMRCYRYSLLALRIMQFDLPRIGNISHQTRINRVLSTQCLRCNTSMYAYCSNPHSSPTATAPALLHLVLRVPVKCEWWLYAGWCRGYSSTSKLVATN